MGRRSRRRGRAEGDEAPARGATTDYRDADGNVLTLRDELSSGTRRQLERLEAKPAADPEDRWQRRVEMLFERLAVRWELAGLPLEGQKELLGRYRMASAEERRRVRAALTEHLAERYPEVVRLVGNGNLWWSGGTNLGVKYALEHGHDYVLTINNDACVHPDFLTHLVSTAQTHPGSIVGAG